jgi:hypothetical protein
MRQAKNAEQSQFFGNASGVEPAVAWISREPRNGNANQSQFEKFSLYESDPGVGTPSIYILTMPAIR